MDTPAAPFSTRPAVDVSCQVEMTVARFETALRAGQSPRIEEFLPDDAVLRHHLLIELIHTETEYRVKAGDRHLVGGYLQRFAELANDPELIAGLVATEYRLVRRFDPETRLEDYLVDHPGVADRVRVLLDDGPPSPPGYEVLGVLGRGGMGVVYWVWQHRLRRTAALKLLRPEGAANTHDLARFHNEARAVARLQHPNIVHVYDVSEHEGRPFITLEYIDGGSLASRLAAGTLGDREAAALLETLGRAVQHAHERGIVHRDLKPANVLLTSAGLPKITDFGLAKMLLDVGGDDKTTPATP